MRKKLTADYVKGLKPVLKPFEVRDTEQRGLLVRVQPTGHRTFYLQYRNAQGKTARVKLGAWPECPVSQARSKAKIELARVVQGEDPAADKRPAPPVADPEVITLRQFVNGQYATWAETPGNMKSARTTMRRLRSGFVPLLDLPLRDLTVEHFELHRTARMTTILPNSRKTPSAATVNRDYAHMRAALSKAVLWRLMASNPLKGVKLAREDKNPKIRALTPEEEGRIMAVFADRRAARAADWAAAGKARGRKLGNLPHFENALEPMFILSLHTGLRQGEARSILWTDIDLVGCTVTVRGAEAKSGQTRTVPLTRAATEALSVWQKQTTGHGVVFAGATESWITNAWRTLCRRASVTGLRWHDLRHSFGSRCARKGVPLLTLKALMGHAHIQTTERYLHSTADDARAAIALLEAEG